MLSHIQGHLLARSRPWVYRRPPTVLRARVLRRACSCCRRTYEALQPFIMQGNQLQYWHPVSHWTTEKVTSHGHSNSWHQPWCCCPWGAWLQSIMSASWHNAHMTLYILIVRQPRCCCHNGCSHSSSAMVHLYLYGCIHAPRYMFVGQCGHMHVACEKRAL